jgi:hypothetical protein
MARISLYVPDELKARMDQVDLNWSDIARPAFVSALAIQHQRSDQSMESAIERLRASKAASLKRDELTGRADGRRWAENRAEYDELVRIANIEINPGTDCLDALYAAYDPEQQLTPEEFKQQLFGDEDADISDAYAEAFILGAAEFFNDVAHKL